eukprot:1511598-Amphidinium_carterae.1
MSCAGMAGTRSLELSLGANLEKPSKTRSANLCHCLSTYLPEFRLLDGAGARAMSPCSTTWMASQVGVVSPLSSYKFVLASLDPGGFRVDTCVHENLMRDPAKEQSSCSLNNAPLRVSIPFTSQKEEIRL